MKVLLITTLYPKDINHSIKETSWAVHELIKGLYSNGIEVVKVIRPLPEIRWRSLKRDSISFLNKIDNIEVETKSFINIPKGGYYFKPQDRDYFNNLLKDVDLVIAHMSDGAMMSHKLYKLFNKPYIYILHNSDLLKVERQKELFRDAKAIYGRSWALNKQLVKKDIDADGVVYSGIEKELIIPYREHNQKTIKILSVNLLQKLKNIDITIEALAELVDYSWEYTIIGDGEELNYIKGLVEKFRLEDRVKFLGFKERSFCMEEMQKSDVFVMPSSPETFGLAYLEAMASGCLVIGAKDWGIDGLIKSGENGYLVKARDIEELKDTFIEIFTQNQSKIYKNSYKKIQEYTLEKAQKNYAKILFENMSNREKYRKFCQKERYIPIFSQDWWLDTVCGEDNWEVVIIKKGGNIMATMPYCTRVGKLNTKTISQPLLTQTLGIYFNYPKNQKYYKKLSFEKEMIEKIVKALPKYNSFSMNFDNSHTNLLPFYWNEFDIKVNYTYVIKDSSLEDLEKRFETDIRRRRRKAEKFGVKVFESEDIEKFYELNKMTFIRQNREIPYSFNFINNLYHNCKKYNACKIFFAKDNDGEIIAGNFLIFDNHTVYYLMGGIEPNKRDLGGMDVVLYESMKFAIKNGKTFDFEGSMVESIEKYFRSFGAVQKPYFQIIKTTSKLLKSKNFLMDILK